MAGLVSVGLVAGSVSKWGSLLLYSEYQTKSLLEDLYSEFRKHVHITQTLTECNWFAKKMVRAEQTAYGEKSDICP